MGIDRVCIPAGLPSSVVCVPYHTKDLLVGKILKPWRSTQLAPSLYVCQIPRAEITEYIDFYGQQMLNDRGS